MATSHFITLNQVRFHHLEWAGNAPPVVFLPGFISNAYAALRLGAVIAPTRRVLAFDLRGRGGSDKPPGQYGMATHLQDTYARLQALDISECVLAGHSFGAALTLFFAHQYPQLVKKIILFDGGAVPSPEAALLFQAYHSNLVYEYPSVESYLAPYRMMDSLQPWTEEAEILTRQNVIEQPDGTAVRSVPRHVVEAELAELAKGDWSQLAAIYPRIQVPVLLIRAGIGSFTRADQHLPEPVLKTLTMPNLTVFDMPDAGHTSILTVPDSGRDHALREFIYD